VEWVRALPWAVTVVLHANHANEFDAEVDAACARLRAAGATLLNQAVLLRGVNDSVEALAELSERGFAAGVLPYYLHQLDRVQGAAHFEVPDAQARALHSALAERLPGYLVPRLVREIAGQPGKSPL
jgi:L-lysine 2,3-aminomutase